MKVILESTEKTVTLVRKLAGGTVEIPARIWEGHTEPAGTPVHAYITRIAIPEDVDEVVKEEFAAELMECKKPSPEIEAIPLRLII